MDWSALPIKRIAIVSSVILFLGAVLVVLWVLTRLGEELPASSSGDFTPPTTASPQPVGGLGDRLGQPTLPATAPSSGSIAPPAQPPAEEVVLSDYVVSLAANPSGGVVAFNPATSTFIQVNSQGNVSNKSEERFFDVKGVTWSRDRSIAVIEDANGKSVYNFHTKERVALPPAWEEFSFSPDNTSIAFKNLGRRGDAQWLVTLNLKTGKISLITPLGHQENRVHVDWSPSNTSVGFVTIPVDGNTQTLSFIAPDGSFASSTTIEGAFFQSQWADNGNVFVFSTADMQEDMRPRLWVALGTGPQRGAYQELPLPTTAQQCSFGGRNGQLLVCAVPERLGAGGYGILDQIPDVPHRLVAVDLTTGIPQTLYTPPIPSALKRPVVATNEKKIYFTNITSGQLESIPYVSP